MFFLRQEYASYQNNKKINKINVLFDLISLTVLAGVYLYNSLKGKKQIQ